MKRAAQRLAKWLALAIVFLLLIGVAAPYMNGDRFASRIRAALETDLSRKVEIGRVHFSLFLGPGFSVENVVIHENPALGIEPIAYVGSLEAVPRLSSLFRGRLEFASIRLDDAIINLAKTGGPSEAGRWNFQPLLSASVIRAIPELHVRSGRLNFKFGDTKSVFYLTDTDLDITPPTRGSAAWNLEFSGQPARTDKPAHGFGTFEARGRWIQEGAGRLILDMRLEQSALGELTALIQGYDAGVHGTASARLHLDGPLDNIRLSGSLRLDDVHRWDLMPAHGQGWPFRLEGRLNLPSQTIELDSSSASGEALPLSVRFRCSNYLSQPHWGVALSWNRFPVEPLLQLARDMGMQAPPRLKMTGTVDGVLGYSGQGSLQGELDFHDASVALPDSSPIRSAQARMIFDRGHARLTPTLVRTALDEEAQLQADYDWTAQALQLSISTDAMRVESLRAQAALAAVPWFEQVPGGTWSGSLQYQPTGWSGDVVMHDASFAVPGLADPVVVQSAVAHINGPRVALQKIQARTGKIAFTGEYRYEPVMARPHRLRLSIPEADGPELERLLMPSLRHSRGLLARALSLGRAVVPEWLADRHLDAAVQIGALHMGDADLSALQARLLWDATAAEVRDIRAKVNGGNLAATLAVHMRGNPVYHLEAHAKGVEWKSGDVDVDGVMESSGTGLELLSHLHSSGAFTARGVEMDALPDLETVTGTYDLVWALPAPRLTFPDLQVVAGKETYTGQGTTEADGRLLIQLSSGSKEMHMSGTLAELRVDEPVAR